MHARTHAFTHVDAITFLYLHLAGTVVGHSLHQICQFSAVHGRCLLHPFLYSIQPVLPLVAPLSSLTLLLPSRVPCRVVFEMVLCWVVWPNQESFHHLTVDKGSCFQAREFTCCLT